jgi:hypothetical protein
MKRNSERLNDFDSLEVSIFLVIAVQVERSPETSAAAADDDDEGRSHNQEDTGSSATCDRMLQLTEISSSIQLVDSNGNSPEQLHSSPAPCSTFA